MSKSGELLQIMKDIAQVSPDTQDLNYSYNEEEETITSTLYAEAILLSANRHVVHHFFLPFLQGLKSLSLTTLM